MGKIKGKHPPRELLDMINVRFVRKAFQHRFVGEACKKFNQLDCRISHDLSSTLKDYKGDELEDIIDPDMPCWGFSGAWSHGKWKDFAIPRAYGGIMIIPDDGSFVYAKEEWGA